MDQELHRAVPPEPAIRAENRAAGRHCFNHRAHPQPFFRKEIVVLDIKNVGGAPYNVQFSPDRVSWKTVATGQTASLWQESSRSGVQGYYQLVNP